MKHTITVKEVQDYLNVETWERAAGSWGDGSNKKLEVNNLTKVYRVTDHDKVVFHGPDLECAVEAYNAAA